MYSSFQMKSVGGREVTDELLRNDAKQFMKACVPPGMSETSLALVHRRLEQTLTFPITVIRSIIAGDALDDWSDYIGQIKFAPLRELGELALAVWQTADQTAHTELLRSLGEKLRLKHINSIVAPTEISLVDNYQRGAVEKLRRDIVWMQNAGNESQEPLEFDAAIDFIRDKFRTLNTDHFLVCQELDRLDTELKGFRRKLLAAEESADNLESSEWRLCEVIKSLEEQLSQNEGVATENRRLRAIIALTIDRDCEFPIDVEELTTLVRQQVTDMKQRAGRRRLPRIAEEDVEQSLNDEGVDGEATEEERVANLKGQLQATEKAKEASIAELNSVIERLQEEADIAGKEKQEIKSKCCVTEEESAELRKSYDLLAAQVSELKVNESTLQSAISKLEARIERTIHEHEDEIGQLKSSLMEEKNELTSEIEESKSTISQLKSRVCEFTVKSEEADQDI
jgi:chromosome segregation ATPase